MDRRFQSSASGFSSAGAAAAERSEFRGMRAIRLSAGGYLAALLPDHGANLISLSYGPLQILHTPPDEAALLREPYSYGIPILCPPNRIHDGSFVYKGKTFSFPPNTDDGACLHGLLHCLPWRVELAEGRGGRAVVRLLCSGKTQPDIAASFGENVDFRIQYTLSPHGLSQVFTVFNNESYALPFGLSFHTAFRVPFAPYSRAENVLLRLPLQSRCRLDPETGYPLRIDDPLDDFERKLAAEGYPPLAGPIDRLYRRDPARPNEALLIDAFSGYEVRYRAGGLYRHWIIWNDDARHGFVGLEPQTWLSNAPCYAQRGETGLGMIDVPAGAGVSLSTSISARRLTGARGGAQI